MVASNEKYQLLSNDASKIWADDTVTIPMSSGHTVAARDSSSLDNVSLRFGHAWSGDLPHVEEHNDLRTSAELSDELGEDDRYQVSYFVEEYTNSVNLCYCSAAESGRELDLSVCTSGQEMGRLEAIFGFCCPLTFFAEAPEHKNEGENGSKHDSKPGASWDFRQC